MPDNNKKFTKTVKPVTKKSSVVFDKSSKPGIVKKSRVTLYKEAMKKQNDSLRKLPKDDKHHLPTFHSLKEQESFYASAKPKDQQKLNNIKKLDNKLREKYLSPYNLKPVPEGNKGKGLSKLPTEVRNKMGYMMDSSHSFKSKVANNMKTMYMGSVYSMHNGDPNINHDTGTPIVKQGENIVLDTGEVVVANAPRYNTVEKPNTTRNLTDRDVWDSNKDNVKDKFESFEKYSEAASKYRKDKGDDFKAETIEIPGGKEKIATQTNDPLKQSYDAGNNFQRNQQRRNIIKSERQSKRSALKTARVKGGYTDEKGDFIKFESGKKKREYKRKLKGKALDRRTRRIDEVNRQQEMQEKQGILTPGADKIKRNFTLKDGPAGRDDTRKDLFSMALSPKAMNYFNRKKK